MSTRYIYIMKVLRRIINPLTAWYRHTAFISGLEAFEEPIHVVGPVYLWNGHVSIGSGSRVYPNVTLWGSGKIEIGKNVEIGIGTVIYASENVEIKDRVSIAANCYIIDSNHGMARDELIQMQHATVKGSVIIEEDAWLGAGAKVLSGVHIGKGTVIGAQALVNRDIPDYAIAVGVPAKVVGWRK